MEWPIAFAISVVFLSLAASDAAKHHEGPFIVIGNCDHVEEARDE